jgi:putative copper resistance protein D
MAAFLDILLRGLALSGQAIAIGGVVFAFILLQSPRGSVERAGLEPRLSRVWPLVALGAGCVGVAQGLSLGVLATALGTGAPLRELLSTAYVRASLVRILASIGLVVGALAVRRRPARWAFGLSVACALVLGVSAAWTSHAAARVNHRAVLLALDALHQLAASAWIGSLLHLAAVALGERQGWWPVALLRRFSTVAVVAVALLIGGGVGLTLAYADGPGALVGTAHGVMILTKALVLGALLALGATNFFAVRRFARAPTLSLLRLRRFVEVEFGLGVTVFFAAASLSSLPPAIDVVADRATPGEVAGRFTPRWPSFTSPSLAELPVDDPAAPRTDADRAWSEYNHHVSGVFVLAMGLLASLHVSGARWARHWPLVTLGLAAFMLVRNDPGAWPLGPQGFWASMAEPTVLQHRVFVLLVVGFGVFEWMVRTGRLRSPRYALVFPLLCAVGGGLLLTHSHASVNLKSEFLLEVTHTPLGVLGLVIGWARWLELRLASPEDRVPGRVWASALAVFGVLLLLYRES